MGFPGGSVVENLPADAGDTDFLPDPGWSPEEGNDNPFQYSCWENTMDREAYSPWASQESDTTECLSVHSTYLESGNFLFKMC